MPHDIFHYYGFDWLASALAVAMIYNLGSGRRIGFAFGMAANLSWFVFAALTLSVPIFLSNIVFITLNFRGWRSWAAKQPASLPTKEQIA